MLRASAEETSTEIELLAISDLSVDPLIEGGRELLDFADALVSHNAIELRKSRHALQLVLGPEAAIAAAATAGNFQMMNRILDATGVPLPKDRSLALSLGIDPAWPSGS